jgi:hypothetical protein
MKKLIYLGVAVAALGVVLTAWGAIHKPASSAAGVPASTLKGWWSSVESDVNALDRDSTAMSAAAKAENMAALHDACARLTADAHTLQADKPAPDASLDSLWQTALADDSRSGTECAAGVATNDAAMLKQAWVDLDAASSAMSQMAGRITAG